MDKVESIQYQAALAITGAWQGSSRSKLYDELGWESLSDRRSCRRIFQIHKIIAGKTPSYLSNLLPPFRRQFLTSVFKEIKCRTNRYSNSFFPDAVRFWNITISDFENFPSISTLKKYATSLIRPVRRSTFGLHDPQGLRFIFQLRVGLSPLRSHKKHHNLAGTPFDKCLCKESVETTRHLILF